FKDGAVGDESEVGQEQDTAGEHEGQPVADLAIEEDRDGDVADAEEQDTRTGEERAQIPGEDAGDEPETKDEVQFARQGGALDETAQDERVGNVPVAAGEEGVFFQRRGPEVREVIAGRDGPDEDEFPAPQVLEIIGLAGSSAPVLIEQAMEGF